MRREMLSRVGIFLTVTMTVFHLFAASASAKRIFVDDDAAGGDGSSWANAFNSLKAAISASVSGDKIWVAEGVYKPDDGSGSRTETFAVKSGTSLYGGFTGNETALEQRNWRVNETVLTGDLAGNDDVLSDISFNENSFHVLTILSGSPNVDGFIISGGNAREDTSAGNSNNYGGGLRIGSGASEPILTNCKFIANKARYGGAFSSEYGAPKILQTIFDGNKATFEGGAIYYHPLGNCAYILNSVFSDNYAGGRGGGISINNGLYVENATLLIHNSILWDNGAGNTGPQIAISYPEEVYFPLSLTIAYSTIEGGEGLIYNRQDRANLDFQDENCSTDPPMFVDADGADDLPGTSDDNFHLQPSSPCIDAGSNTFIPCYGGSYPVPLDVDFDLKIRIYNEIIDMGVYEHTNIIHVDKDATGFNDGTNWHDAFRFLQDGLSSADPDNEIWVAEGTYYPTSGVAQPGDTVAMKREYTFALKSGVGIYGGFNGTEKERLERNWLTNETILSGAINMKFDTDNSYNVVTAIADETAILDGFTIRRGFADNLSSYKFSRGAGIHGGNATIVNCKIQSNVAIEGGGMFGRMSSIGNLFNCRFLSNQAEKGGGFHAEINSDYRLTNCSFLDNTADMGGAIYMNSGGSHLLTNCTLSRNNAASLGGGIYAYSAFATVYNTILWDNIAAVDGHELALVDSHPEIFRTALPDGPHDLYKDNGSYSGSYIVQSDPLFADTQGRLSPGSPCIDAGDSRAVPLDITDIDDDGDTTERMPIDLDSLDRFVDDPTTVDKGIGDPPDYPQIVDMGAYERQRPPNLIFYVDTSATGANTGLSWADAYVNLQDALQSAQTDDEIWVATGTYKPTQGGSQPADPRDATFQLKNGLALYGGFPQGGGNSYQRDPVLYPTILSGDRNGDDGTDFSNYGENVRHVVTGSGTNATAIIDGFIIIGGNASDVPYPAHSGGGMYNYFGSPTVNRCVFRDNLAESRGGGMFNQEGNPQVNDCLFVHNAAQVGGALYNGYSAIASVVGCTFSDNQANEYGGAIQDVYDSDVTYTNCTFSRNVAGISGGAIRAYACNPTLVNTIVWNNSDPSGHSIDLDYSTLSINCSDVEGGAAAISNTTHNWNTGNNTDENPLFCDAISADFHLAENSPCTAAASLCGVLIGAWPIGCGTMEVCEADMDNDADVDAFDLEMFCANYGRTTCSNCPGDFGGDGDVDGADFHTMAWDYGKTQCAAP